MVQVQVNDRIFDGLKEVMDNHPVFGNFGLHHKSDYVNEALKDFIKCNCDYTRKIIDEGIDRILAKIVENQCGEQ